MAVDFNEFFKFADNNDLTGYLDSYFNDGAGGNNTFNIYNQPPSSGGGADAPAYNFDRFENILGQYGENLSNLNTRFDEFNPLVQEDIASGVGKFFTTNNPLAGLQDSIANLSSDFNSLNVPDIYQFGDLFSGQSDYLTGQMGDQFSNLSSSIGDRFDSLGNQFTNIDNTLGGLYGSEGFGGLSNSISDLSREIGNIPTGLDFGNILAQGLGGLSDNFGTQFDSIRNSLPDIYQFSDMLGGQYDDITNYMGGQFDNLGDRFSDQMGGFGSQLSNFEREMGNRLGGLYGDEGFGGLSNTLAGMSRDIGNMPTGLDFANMLGDATSGLSDQIGGIADSLPDIYQFGDMLGGQYDDLTGFMGDQYGNLSDQISGISDSLPDIYQFGDMLGGQYDDLTGFMGDRFGGLDSALSDISRNIGNIPTGLDFGNILGQGLDTLTDQFGSRFDTLGDSIADAYKGPSVDQFGDMFSGQSDYLINQIGGGEGGFGDIYGGVQGIQNTLDNYDFDQMFSDQTSDIENLFTQNNERWDTRFDNMSSLPEWLTDQDQLRGILGDVLSQGNAGMPSELGTLLTDIGGAMTQTPDQLSNEELDYLTGRSPQLNEVGGIVGPDDTGYGEGYSLDEFEMGDQPVLDMPDIDDFRSYLTNPLVDGVTEALGSANPFDTRMDAMLAGEDNVIDRQYEEALENINHQFGLTDNLGSPAYRQAIADLNRDRADSKIRLRSDFQQQAAATDEGLRRNRLGDLSQALTQTTGLFTDEMSRQNQFQQQAIDDYYRNLAASEAAYYRPLNYEDEGMRMAMGGIGQAISPSGSAANQGLMNAANMYSGAANQSRQGSNALANTLMDFGQGAYNWYTNR